MSDSIRHAFAVALVASVVAATIGLFVRLWLDRRRARKNASDAAPRPVAPSTQRAPDRAPDPILYVRDCLPPAEGCVKFVQTQPWSIQ